jgi:4-amino-4-deoxy-L-arabinose transferase-like glycosyltransferase
MTTAPLLSLGSGTRPRRILQLALILALLLPRLVLVWNGFAAPQRSLLTDSAGYLELAESIRLEGRFHASEHEESLRTPGYPAFLALVQAIFGERLGFVILVQILLTLVTAWLVFRSARALGGERVGLAAVWLYALSPNALFWAGTVMTETFFAFWLALALALLIQAVQRDSWRRGAASGLALGLAVLTRPIGLYLIPLWAVGALVAAWRRTPHRRALANAVVLLLAALTPVLTWQTRNLLVHDSFRLTASFRTVFVDYTAASTLGEARGISRDEAAAQLRQSPDAFAAALDAVRRYPGSLVRVSLQGIARTALGTEAGTWLGILNGEAYQSSGLLESLLRGDLRGTADALSLRLQASEDRLGTALLLWGLLYSAAVYLLGFRGLMRLRRLQPGNLGWLCAVVLLSTGCLIVLPLTIGDARFRVPVEPLLALLGSMGFTKRPVLAAPAGQASE